MENYEQYGSATTRIPAGCTLQEYRKNYASAPLKKSIKSNSIFAYVLVGVNLLLGIFLNPAMLIDVAVLLGLTLGVHLGKSKGCAIALLIFTILCSVVSLVSTGRVTGWWWIFVAVSYLSTFKKIDAEYKAEMAKHSAAPYGVEF